MSILGRIKNIFARSGRTVDVPSAYGAVRPIRGRYDAAQTTDENGAYWAATDALSADLANSLGVRKKLRERARYEIANNCYAKGLDLTQAYYIVGRGPKLRLTEKDQTRNTEVESAWKSWCRATQLNRKLRTMAKVKVGDGEAVGRVMANQSLRDKVKLDFRLIECDQLTSPYLPTLAINRVDGIEFDDLGNPMWYDILKYHPGGQWAPIPMEVERVRAKFVVHWFREDRPGQHRGIPEITPALSIWPGMRRFTSATIKSAEVAASISIALETDNTAGGEPDEVTPGAVDIPLGTMWANPYGWRSKQIASEHPNDRFDTFRREMIAECGRTLNMPYNIAAADSSSYNYSSGRLDHETYFLSIDVERDDCEALALEKIFALWWEEAVKVYGWASDPDAPPSHTWDWNAMPQIDPVKTAQAREINLRTGSLSPREVASEDGVDFEERLQAMAEDYGLTSDEMRETIRDVIFAAGAKEQTPSGDPPEPEAPKQNSAFKTNGKTKGKLAGIGL